MDKELLFKPRCPEKEVTVAGVGVLRVRGMTRAEIITVTKKNDAGENTDPWVLSLCLVDPPVTEAEATQWLEVAQFGEIEAVTKAINEASGISEYASKEAYKSLRDEP